MSNSNPKPDIADRPCLYSGGAAGTDVAWEAAARAAGHDVRIMSFAGHHLAAVPHAIRAPGDVQSLTEAELAEADQHVRAAAAVLRRPPTHAKQYVQNLLRRNWFQVRDVDAVYAVGTFDARVVEERRFLSDTCGGMHSRGLHVGIEGGTAWAMQMFLLRWLHEHPAAEQGPSANVPMYFFNGFGRWYEATLHGNFLCRRLVWRPITHPPQAIAPGLKYAGIGSRSIAAVGARAVFCALNIDHRDVDVASFVTAHGHGNPKRTTDALDGRSVKQ